MSNDQWDDDLRAEGPPEPEFVPGIAGTFARKRIAAAALIRDPEGRFLLLEPIYKSTWLLPGGVVEADEDPLTACTREVQEEIGLDLTPGALLIVDWVPQHGVWGESLQFVFDCGRLPADRVGDLKLQESEIRRAEFVTLERALTLTPASLGRRLGAALAAADQGRTTYLRFGRP